MTITPDLATEIQRRVANLGYDGVEAWVGSENFEMRVDGGADPEWIDRRILAILRAEA